MQDKHAVQLPCPKFVLFKRSFLFCVPLRRLVAIAFEPGRLSAQASVRVEVVHKVKVGRRVPRSDKSVPAEILRVYQATICSSSYAFNYFFSFLFLPKAVYSQSSFALYFSLFGSRVFSPHNNTGLEARLEIIVNGMDPRTDTFFPSNCSLQISEGWLQLQATFPATVAVSRPETYLGIIRTIETLDTAAVQYCGRAHVVVEPLRFGATSSSFTRRILRQSCTQSSGPLITVPSSSAELRQGSMIQESGPTTSVQRIKASNKRIQHYHRIPSCVSRCQQPSCHLLSSR